jgi:SEC-C motif domain protein
MKLCPCTSNKPFAECCEPALLMKAKPLSARNMVRARYCAYSLGAGTYREFLMRTWHPSTAHKVSMADLTNDNFAWNGLEIVFAEQKGDKARVEFKATYTDSDGKSQLHHELSLFHRMKGVWLYLDGQLRSSRG